MYVKLISSYLLFPSPTADGRDRRARETVVPRQRGAKEPGGGGGGRTRLSSLPFADALFHGAHAFATPRGDDGSNISLVRRQRRFVTIAGSDRIAFLQLKSNVFRCERLRISIDIRRCSTWNSARALGFPICPSKGTYVPGIDAHFQLKSGSGRM